MLHADDAVARADAEVHCAAHAGHAFAGDDPVCEVAFLVDFQSAEEARVHVPAANETEVRCGVDEAAAERHGCDVAARVDDVVRIVVRVLGLRRRACADDAELGMDDKVNALGKEAGDHGGKADAEVDDVAVLQFFRAALCDERFDFVLIHYFLSPSTM